MAIPQKVEQLLASPVFRRETPAEVIEIITRMSVQLGGVFIEFYTRYAGPFGSKNTAFELLDLVLGDENIEVNTELCRTKFHFPNQYLVISGLLAGSVLVYDMISDGVFNIDLEGGEKDLISGTAKPEWKTFFEFLESFFSGV